MVDLREKVAGNIASKEVETSATGATMPTYSHNNLNQITGIGGSGGVKQVIVRGQTNEPATVKVKPSITSVWKDARMLEGNRFESDQDPRHRRKPTQNTRKYKKPGFMRIQSRVNRVPGPVGLHGLDQPWNFMFKSRLPGPPGS